MYVREEVLKNTPLTTLPHHLFMLTLYNNHGFTSETQIFPTGILLLTFDSNLFPVLHQFNSIIIPITTIGDILEMYWRYIGDVTIMGTVFD